MHLVLHSSVPPLTLGQRFIFILSGFRYSRLQILLNTFVVDLLSASAYAALDRPTDSTIHQQEKINSAEQFVVYVHTFLPVVRIFGMLFGPRRTLSAA